MVNIQLYGPLMTVGLALVVPVLAQTNKVRDHALEPLAQRQLQTATCTCNSCTGQVLDSNVGGATCRQRIQDLVDYPDGFPTETSACYQVAGLEFLAECGACDPSTCDGRGTDVKVSAFCGCSSCTYDLWMTSVANDSGASGTFASNVNWRREVNKEDEATACAAVSNQFAGIMGTACDPTQCGTPAPRCGCASCDDATWNAMADTFTCGARMEWAERAYYMTEHDSCRLVSKTQFPTICGPNCDPDACQTLSSDNTPVTAAPITPAPVTTRATAAPSTSTAAPISIQQPPPPAAFFPVTLSPVMTAPVSTPSPFATIPIVPPTPAPIPTATNTGVPINIYNPPPPNALVPSTLAPVVVITTPAPVPAPVPTATSAPVPAPVAASTDARCGCNSCDAAAWNVMANSYSCGDRITWVMGAYNYTETQACQQVAGIEFPNVCGPACDPLYCDGRKPAPADLVLYCYKSPSERVTYSNMWSGQYTLQVKQDPINDATCGPNANMFSEQAVSVNTNTNELTLEFKYSTEHASWLASEVRVVKPNPNDSFSYGTYRFSVKSIQVIDDATNTVIRTSALPASLNLGLFTWDPTEDYAAHENYNHEVDIEISQWDDVNNLDAQFLVQPPEQPQYFRFSTRNAATGALQQDGHTYEFTWNPGAVDWSTTAGGGVTHSYITAQALSLGLTDYVQCLPAQMEVRINLWNLRGSQSVAELTSTTQRVVVVIDDFTHTPSTLTHIEDGQACSKNCQCATTSSCMGNVCTPN